MPSGSYASEPRGSYRQRVAIRYEIGLTADSARSLLAECGKRGITSQALLEEIVERVLQDKLLDAVLDDA